MSDKIDPELRLEFERRPGGVYGVVVLFTALPDEATLDEWDLTAVPPKEATGQLTRARIEALAARADVARIRSRPKPRGF